MIIYSIQLVHRVLFNVLRLKLHNACNYFLPSEVHLNRDESKEIMSLSLFPIQHISNLRCIVLTSLNESNIYEKGLFSNYT